MFLHRPARKILMFSLAIGISACTGSSRAQTEAASIDYRVYDAVLDTMQFPIKDPHIVISDTTLNIGCGDKSNNPVRLNDCGIWSPESAKNQVETVLQQSFPEMESATWNNLVSRNAMSIKLQDSFQSSWPHQVRDIATKSQEKVWSHPDGIVLLSQVGFNGKKNEALVYVLFLSYIKQVHTSGNFFLVRMAAANQWKIVERATYMEIQ